MWLKRYTEHIIRVMVTIFTQKINYFSQYVIFCLLVLSLSIYLSIIVRDQYYVFVLVKTTVMCIIKEIRKKHIER